MVLIRLIAALLLIPPLTLLAYEVALTWNLDRTTIDVNGGGLGVFSMVAFVFLISWVADDHEWFWRGGTMILVATLYFVITWRQWGSETGSPDARPDVVWFGACVAAFSPGVVIMAAFPRVRSWWRSRIDGRRVTPS